MLVTNLKGDSTDRCHGNQVGGGGGWGSGHTLALGPKRGPHKGIYSAGGKGGPALVEEGHK